MLTDDQYKVYKKYKKIIEKIVKKQKGIIKADKEDLMSEGKIALIQGVIQCDGLGMDDDETYDFLYDFVKQAVEEARCDMDSTFEKKHNCDSLDRRSYRRALKRGRI